MSFQKAQKQQARLRLALLGPAGAGKTYTALTLASYLGEKIAVIDTEHGSAAKYADLFDFDTVQLTDFAPENYITHLRLAADAGYDVAIVDSLSHEWKWCLEEVDRVKARTRNPNSFAAWKEITPRHDSLTEAILASPLHVIATMRTKMEHVLEEDERGKKVPRKIGMAPVQRDGVEYEFDLIGDLDLDNKMVVSKTRCPELAGAVIRKPGKELAETLKVWLGSGTVPEASGAPDVTAGEEVAPNPAGPEKPGGDGAHSDLVQKLEDTLKLLNATDSLAAVHAHRDDKKWLERQLKRAEENLELREGTDQFPIPDSAKVA